MKLIIVIIAFLSLCQTSIGQYCISERFDTTAFSLSQIDSVMNEKFGQNYNWQDTEIQDLKLDIYFPKTGLDPLEKRPLIVMIHSGGFYLGTRNRYRYYCREFAKRGFVAATIDYRIGWDVGLGQHYDTLPIQTQAHYPFNCLGDSTSSIKALYRALQDQKAAIRYLVHYADTVVNIDTNYIFVGGGSAGGVSSLGLQYLQQEFFDAQFGYLHLKDSLGSLDSSSNTFTESFSLAGIISMWGAVPDTSVITKSNSLPTLMIHCTGDTLVPCISSNFYSCPNYIPAQGACIIKDRLKNLNQCYEFNYYDASYPQNGCHDVYSYDYHIKSISRFAKRVMCKDCRQISIENQIEIGNDTILISAILNPVVDKSNINIYPNPTNSKLNISSSTEIISVHMYNLLGQEVKLRHIQNNVTCLMVDNLQAGIYVLKIKLINDKIILRKVIIKGTN